LIVSVSTPKRAAASLKAFWIGIGFVGLVAIGLMVMLLKMKSQFTSIQNLLPKIQTT